MQYLESRKKVYCAMYARLIQKTDAFQKLKALHDAGVNLQFIDVDIPGPLYGEGILVSEQSYKQYMNDLSLSFGHTWTLAACLMGAKWWEDN